jgi:hypothetical protein
VTGLGKYKGRLIVLLDMARLLDLGSGQKTEAQAGMAVEARRAAAGK